MSKRMGQPRCYTPGLAGVNISNRFVPMAFNKIACFGVGLFRGNSLIERYLRSAYAPLRILKVSAVDIGSIGTAFRPQPIGYPESIISQKSKPGKAHVLVVPIGFVADHLEILYDIEAQEFARSHGLNLKRTASLDTSPGFIAALADIASRRL